MDNLKQQLKICLNQQIRFNHITTKTQTQRFYEIWCEYINMDLKQQTKQMIDSKKNIQLHCNNEQQTQANNQRDS